MTNPALAARKQMTLARTTGWLYLLIIICAGFSQGAVREAMMVPGDAAATTANLIASEGLFRLGMVTDLIAFLTDAIVSVLLYLLLRQVNHTLALISTALRLIAHPAIASLNMVFHWLALHFALGGSGMEALQAAQSQQLSLLALELHNTGYLVAGVFFGAHLLLLGYLFYRSELLPRVMGGLIIAAGFGYLIESVGMFLDPGNEAVYGIIVMIPAVLGEVGLALWLVIKGVTVRVKIER